VRYNNVQIPKFIRELHINGNEGRKI
jgi:hypothetical protein